MINFGGVPSASQAESLFTFSENFQKGEFRGFPGFFTRVCEYRVYSLFFCSKANRKMRLPAEVSLPDIFREGRASFWLLPGKIFAVSA